MRATFMLSRILVMGSGLPLGEYFPQKDPDPSDQYSLTNSWI
jgi:hypothetical protein